MQCFVHVCGCTSISTIVPSVVMQGYGAAKAGLVGLTHAQAATLQHKTRVNAVLPGWIDTSGDPNSITQADNDWHWTGDAIGQVLSHSGRLFDFASCGCVLCN